MSTGTKGQEERRGPLLPWLALLGLIGGAAWWLLRGGEAAAPATARDGAAPRVQAPALRVGEDEERRALDLRQAARASLSGTVRDEQGRPIAGAQVCVWVDHRVRAAQEDKRAPTCVQSGADGRYRVEGLLGARVRVSAGAPGFVPLQYTRGAGAGLRDTVDLRPGLAAADVDLVLAGGGVEVRGAVKDLSGGAIEGALVTLEGGAVTTSDAEGNFSTWVRPQPSVWAWATADGYAEGHASGAAPGHFFELYLTPEAVLIGKVVRAGDGSPVADAEVRAVAGEGWDSASTLSDAAGNFRVDRLQPGAYKAHATADDAAGVAEVQVILGIGETSAPVTITAHPAFYVEGRILRGRGEGCDAGTLVLADAAIGYSGWHEAEADGLVRVRGLQPGTYSVEAKCRGEVSAESYAPVAIVDRSVEGLKWGTEPGLAIRGVVVDAKGTPVPDISLSARSRPDPDDPRARQSSASGRSDAAGRFELAGLLAGTYDVSASAYTAPRPVPPKPLEVKVDRDVDGLRVELPASGELRGRVRDPQGRAIAGASVRLVGGAEYLATDVADDGSFVFLALAEGEYRAVAQRGWSDMRAPGTSDDDVQGVRVAVRAGASARVELVVEERTGTLTGTVRAEGGPVSDAFVEATRESDSAASASGGAMRERWGSYFEAPHMTDHDGKFALSRLAPGKYTVRAYRKGGGEAIREHVEVGSDVALEIAVPGQLAGTVTIRGGGAPQEFTVRLHDDTTGYRRTDTFFRTDGRWRFLELPRGKYKLDVTASDGVAEAKVELGESEAREGVRIELAPRVTVRGRLVDLDGEPVPGMRVTISAGGAWNFGGPEGDRRNVSDEDGRFEVERAPTGPATVIVIPPNFATGEFGWTQSPVRIPEGKEVAELPDIRLARARVKDEEVEGSFGYTLKSLEPEADPMDRKLVVAVVRPGGPAAQAGLQVGDQIVSVDGHDVTGASAYLAAELTRVLAGQTVRFGLARGVTLAITAGKQP